MAEKVVRDHYLCPKKWSRTTFSGIKSGPGPLFMPEKWSGGQKSDLTHIFDILSTSVYFTLLRRLYQHLLIIWSMHKTLCYVFGGPDHFSLLKEKWSYLLRMEALRKRRSYTRCEGEWMRTSSALAYFVVDLHREEYAYEQIRARTTFWYRPDHFSKARKAVREDHFSGGPFFW